MLRITLNKSAVSAVKYFDEGLTKSDYYSLEDKIAGKWNGKAAKLLELSGDVSRSEFSRLANNQHPITGEQLTARNNENRRVGYDFTFSVPKSVSILHSLTDDREIVKAFNESVQSTMSEIEKDAEVRIRKNGAFANRNSGNLVWANFTHEEARPVNGLPDPHLHQHVFCFNTSFDDKEKQWKAVDVSDIKSNAPYFQAMFHANLASELKKVGYEVERDRNNFQVKGFSRNLVEKFSSRTKQVNDKAKKLEGLSEKQKSELGAKTRANKRKGYKLDELKMQWKSRLSEEEKLLLQNAKKSGSNGFFSEARERKEMAKQALDYSIEHNFERKSVATEKELLLHALKKGVGKVNYADLKKQFDKNQDLLQGKDKEGRTVFTTEEALAEEKYLIKTAREGKGAFEASNPKYTPKNALLTNEQKGAVEHALTSKDFITAIGGKAGTGKTWSIKEIRNGAEEAGIRFSAFAPSSNASRQVQREEGFESATTVAELLQSKKLQEKQKNGMIWVDEAGLLGNKDMKRVVEIAKEQNARILLSGDVKQHNSVQRGDALRIAQDFGGVKSYYLTDIKRQKTKEYKNAVKNISDGAIAKGIDRLDEMGAIKEHDDFTSLKKGVSDEYVKAVKEKTDVLLVAATHNQGRQITESIREKLKEEGLIGTETNAKKVLENLSYTEAQKKDTESYQKGMVIGFHQNAKGGIVRGSNYRVDSTKDDKVKIRSEEGKAFDLPINDSKKFSVYKEKELELAKGDKIRITQNGSSGDKKRINNGNVFQVERFLEDGNMMLRRGRAKVILGKEFQHFDYGYYSTSPSSQGKTADKVIIAQDSSSGKAASQEQFYVSASRGKFGISIHTDDKKALQRNVSRSSQDTRAVDFQKRERRNRVVKKMKDMRKAVVKITQRSIGK